MRYYGGVVVCLLWSLSYAGALRAASLNVHASGGYTYDAPGGPSAYVVPGLEVDSGESFINGYIQRISIRYWGEIEGGTIRAYAESRTRVVSAGAAPDTYISAHAFARLGMRMTDTLHFVSDVLPPASPVLFRIIETLDARAAHIGPGDLACPESPDSQVSLRFESFFDPGISVGSCGVAPLSPLSQVFLLTSAVGSSHTFAIELAVQARTGISGRDLLEWNEMASADARNTARVTVEVLTPGVSFWSNSGFSYSSAAVPEPATLGLAAAGLLAFFVRSRIR